MLPVYTPEIYKHFGHMRRFDENSEETYLHFPTVLTHVIVSDHRARDARKGGRLTGDHLAPFFMYAGSEYKTISGSPTSMRSLSMEDEDG